MNCIGCNWALDVLMHWFFWFWLHRHLGFHWLSVQMDFGLWCDCVIWIGASLDPNWSVSFRKCTCTSCSLCPGAQTRSRHLNQNNNLFGWMSKQRNQWKPSHWRSSVFQRWHFVRTGEASLLQWQILVVQGRLKRLVKSTRHQQPKWVNFRFEKPEIERLSFNRNDGLNFRFERLDFQPSQVGLKTKDGEQTVFVVFSHPGFKRPKP